MRQVKQEARGKGSMRRAAVQRAQEQRRLQASGPKGTIINMAFLGLESGALAKGHHSPAAALRWSCRWYKARGSNTARTRGDTRTR